MRRLSLLCLMLITAVSYGAEIDRSEFPDNLKAMEWREVGPYRGGRSAAVAGIPDDRNTYYFGGTGGGVWKTQNAGQSWRNVSDGFFGGSIGAVAVSLPLAARADGPGGRRIMVISGIGFGVGVMLLGLAPTIWLAFLVVVGIGAFTTAFQSLSNTLALTAADDNMQGRVQSLMQLSFAGFGIAAAPIGALAEVIGLRAALVIMGAVAAAATVVFHILERAADRRTENEANAMMSQTPKVQVRQ